MNKILVMGVGGAGTDLAGRVAIALGSPVGAINTDKNALNKSELPLKLLIGSKTCGGQNAVRPDRGRRAAQESKEDIRRLLADVQLLVLAAGLGGGTGTGATPVIAQLANELGIKVIVAVTLPLEVEEKRRQDAEEGLCALQALGYVVVTYDFAKQKVAQPFIKMINDAAEVLCSAVVKRVEMAKQLEN